MNQSLYRILIVDDEQDMREELTALLKDDFMVETASDGEAGLMQLINNDFDIAVIDLRMPKMDGFELIKQIKAKNIQLPIVMLTGKGGIQDAFEASKLGVDKWVEKSSLDSEKLIQELKSLIKKSPDYRPTVRELILKNFTAFTETTLTFSPQLNIFIGENATGKTHILKSCYAGLSAIAERVKVEENPSLDKLNIDLSDKFFGVFRPDFLNHLIRYQQDNAEIQINFENADCDLHFSIQKDNTVNLHQLPATFVSKSPVYLSTREMLGIYQNFQAIYDQHYIRFDETWRDVCVSLGGFELREIDEGLKAIIDKIASFIGGKIELDDKNGNFYLNTPEKGRLEAQLISEGQRKLAMLARLIQTNALQNGYLFWDEPEANLNPHFIKEIAPILLELSRHGVQVFIATHSLFLLREIEICLTQEDYKKVQVRWFGLHEKDNAINVEQGWHVDDLGDIAVLDEELNQSDRFLDSGA